MDLKDFIQKAINDITGAVDEANKNASRKITFKKHEGKRTVEFDIAVTAENIGKDSVGAGIKVLSLIDLGGKTTSEIKNSIVSRITVGVDLDEDTHSEKAIQHQAQRELNKKREAVTVNYADSMR
jgi:hypothetical protein